VIERRDDRLLLSGAITFADVTRWRAECLAAIDRDGLTLDLAGVGEADSSALSLLLELQRAARERGYRLACANMPAGLKSLAEVYAVVELVGGS